MQDCQVHWNSGRLWQQSKQHSPATSFPELVWTWICRCPFLPFVPPRWILPFFWLPLFPVLRAPPRWAFCPCRRWRRGMLLPVETQSHQVLLDCRTTCCAVLSSNVTEFEVHLCLRLVEGLQKHLLVVKNLLVSTMVLLEDWDRHFSWRACSHYDVVVGKALHAWCSSWRCSRGTCSRGTWRTSPSVHPIATWDARHVSSLCHRLSIEVWLPRLLAPLFLHPLFPTRHSYCCTIVRSFHRSKCCSDSVHRFLIGSMPDATWTHVHSFWYFFRQERHWRVAEASLLSINSSLPIS